MLSNARSFVWSSLFSLALTQTATIRFFNPANVCQFGLFAQCSNLPPGVCCFISGLATCADFRTNGGNGVATLFLAANDNQCGIPILQLANGVCACPNGAPIISAANWRVVTRAVDGEKQEEEEECTPVNPDVYGWKDEDGATWVLHETDDVDTFAKIAVAAANDSLDQIDVGKLIKEHGTEV
ncbi:hypothetical protein TARUN_2951 [Trichoderma arundinaceum]|uniref:Uncharacterized protein n=1 Tax=Trichoderma arundinaceum TaxID=490622 RepID=A0A395NT57_TRIAR|nr:hypothetical protein TARUN_2951 [Trichoderma arundinaceum]